MQHLKCQLFALHNLNRVCMMYVPSSVKNEPQKCILFHCRTKLKIKMKHQLKHLFVFHHLKIEDEEKEILI